MLRKLVWTVHNPMVAATVLGSSLARESDADSLGTGEDVESIEPASMAAPRAPYSLGIAAGGFVFVAGQVPVAADHTIVSPGDVEAQTHAVIRNVETVLRAAGCGLSDVVSVNSYLADEAFHVAYNTAYEAAFAGHRPARTTIVAQLMNPQYLVEMSAIAVMPRRPDPAPTS